MLWSIEKGTILTTVSKNFALLKHMSIDRHRCYMAAKFGVLLMRTVASFLSYTGYLNFINSHISLFYC